eukprot:95167_1
MSAVNKYKYCPDYDDFLCKSKQKLQERLIHHHNLKQPLIHQAVLNTINQIKNLGYGESNEEIKNYETSFINIEQIDKYISDWKGPEISRQYIADYNNVNSENYNISFGFDKFHKNAVNWQDQSSYRVIGTYFLSKHISQLRQYFTMYCNNIVNISEKKTYNIINYACIYCGLQLLLTKVKFKRTKKQPLIRFTTLRDSKELHNAFKILYPQLDLIKLKQMVKNNNKYNPNKKGGQQYRINSTQFAENLIVYATDLLKTEKQNIGLIP